MAVGLGLIAVAAVVIAVAGPRARTWSMQRAIEVFDLPTSVAAARQQGADYYVLEPRVDACGWTAGFGLVAVVALAAVLYVLHVRRRLQRD